MAPRLPLPDSVARVAERAGLEAFGLLQLGRAGVLRPEAPQRAVAAARAIRAYGALGGAVGAAAARHPDRVALADERGELTYAELDRRSHAIARAWRERGVGEDATVGILVRNHRGFADALLAAAKLGAKILLLNTDFAGPQLRDVGAREGVTLLVHDEEYADLVSVVDASHGHVVAWTDGEPPAGSLESLAQGDATPVPAPEGEARVVLLTSGTTGTPKGAPRPDPRSLVPLGSLLSKVPVRAGQTTVLGVPAFHALGLAHLGLGLGFGCKVVLRRRFDPKVALADVERHGAEMLVVVPVMLRRMLDAREGEDLSSLRIVFCGGAQLEAPLASRALRELGDVVYNLYGSTEVAWATIATPADLRAAPGCAGRPPLGTRVRLYDEHDRPVEGPGRVGRIFVGNSFQFEGYTGGGTKAVIDGLMSSGDVGHFDEGGRLFIDGRDDDMVVSGGENVFPGEVEELLMARDDVAEAAVIGVPDEEFGARLVAFVVPAEGAQLDEETVRAHVKANLARFKVPREVRFLDELPRNPTGKVLKRELAERAAAA